MGCEPYSFCSIGEQDTKVTTKKRVGQRIRKYRLHRKMSLEELGGIVEADFSHLGKVERGERGVSIELIQRIAKALNVRVEDLLT